MKNRWLFVLAILCLASTGWSQTLAPAAPETTGVTDGLNSSPLEKGARPKTSGFLFMARYPLSADAYFGKAMFSAGDYVAISGFGNAGKSISAKVLGFRITHNLQLSLYSAVTTDETESPTKDSGTPGSATPSPRETEAALDKFVQTGGNASLVAELPVFAYVSAIVPKSPANTIQNLFAMTGVSSLNFTIAPLGSSTGSGVSNGQIGLRFFGQKAAVDDANIAVFADVFCGGLFGSDDFFGSLGMQGRSSALYGKFNTGIAVLKRFRLTITKTFMGPEALRSPFMVSFSVQPG